MSRIRIKAASERLIRKLVTIKKLNAEYGLLVNVILVALECNLADRLIRVA